MDQLRILWLVLHLISCLASRHKQQQVGCVCYLEVVRFVITAQDGVLIFVPSDDKAENKCVSVY